MKRGGEKGKNKRDDEDGVVKVVWKAYGGMEN